MAYLREFGSYLPSRVVSNDEIGARVGADHNWIRNVSGIEERRFAAEGESVESMAVCAGRDCLSRAGVAEAEVGMVIVASGSADRQFPGPAATVARDLGCTAAVALDLPMASAGSLFGLAIASRMAEQFREILVIGAEKMSNVVLREPMERGVAVLFGDGAGAALISSRSGRAVVLDSVIATDGAYSGDLKLEPDRPLEMNGRTVILQASRKIPTAIQAVLERVNVAVDNVSAFLMHQANQNLIDRVAESLGVPSERFYSNIRRYGNTSSASLLIAAAEWSREKGFQPDVPAVFAAFGAGFHWGALVARGI